MNINLDNLATATNQQVFEYIATHLLKQNEVCNSDGNCAYHYNDKRCAAGCLISEEQYVKLSEQSFDYGGIQRQGIEGSAWDTLVRANLVPGNHINLILAMQDIHDTYAPWEWKTTLEEYASGHNIDFTFIKDIQ